MGTMAKCVVLLVDDDKLLLRALSRRLKNVNLITAGNVTEERAVLSQCPDIVLTDYSLPGGTGLELLEEVQLQCPRTRRFLMTGTLQQVPDEAILVADEVFEKTSVELETLVGDINAGKIL
jgi:response regulator RpfG family c-di-GMP phosphodiesterase